MDLFFKALNKNDFKIREVTKGALTQARAKLKPYAFIRMIEVAVTTFYQHAQTFQWYGMRLTAVDGTRLMLPNHSSIIEEFGLQKFGPKADSERSLAMASLLYDALNMVTIDAKIAPYKSSERDLLVQHLDKLGKGDLLLLDRGYPCFWLLFLLKAKGVEFCVRLKDDWWLQVKDFTESPDKEHLVTFKLPYKDRKKLAGYLHMIDAELTCRLVKVELLTGETEVLCTSLIDAEKYPHHEFDELYHFRWNEEEAYKLLKCRVELENFSGKTARAIKQDFFAKVLLLTLSAVYAHPVEEKVKQEYKAGGNRKHDQKINRTNAVSMAQDIIIAVLLRKQYATALSAFDSIVANTREIIRPGRNMPRKKKQKKPYSMNYKRL